MPESATHSRLVQHLLEWVQMNISQDNTLVLVDLPSTPPGDKPPAIGGFHPDLYCRLHDGLQVLIGEAKTAGDIDTRHSREQFRAFLLYLTQYPAGTLLIAVPWFVVNQAKTVIRALQRTTNTHGVRLVFLEQLPG